MTETIDGGNGSAAYHEHLKICPQCEQHPFNPCEEGARLLRLAAQELAHETLRPKTEKKREV